MQVVAAKHVTYNDISNTNIRYVEVIIRITTTIIRYRYFREVESLLLLLGTTKNLMASSPPPQTTLLPCHLLTPVHTISSCLVSVSKK